MRISGRLDPATRERIAANALRRRRRKRHRDILILRRGKRR